MDKKNIISTFYLGSKLDIETIYQNSEIDCIFDTINPYLIMFTKFGTLYIFPNGKVTNTGAKSIMQSKKAAQICLEAIQETVYPHARILDYRIQNMSGVCTLQTIIQKRNRKGTPR